LGFDGESLAAFERGFHRPYGAVLVTGPTGSGKSTTLYAALKELNATETKIITIEDPVEYQLAGINQINVNRKAGLTFATGLRSILRADPDVIMVGEIRDGETARIAIEADHDHVGVGAQDRAQPGREGQARLAVDVDLVD